VDGYGPGLLIMVGDRVVPLPEVTPVYMGPLLWNRTQWWAITRMGGAKLYVDGTLEFCGACPNSSKVVEGLVYLQCVRYMAASADIARQPNAPYLYSLMDTIENGARPWLD